MINLFYRKDMLSTPSIKDNRLRYLRERFNTELTNITEYYHNRNSKVKNDNILVGIITTVCPNIDLNIWEFLRILDSTALYNTKTFGIVSNVNKGYIHNDTLFKHNSKEIYIYDDSDIDYDIIENTWKDLKPLRILRHDSTDLNFKIPSDRYGLEEDTLTVCSIDIKLLCLQYRYWAIERLYNDFDIDPAYFIYRYVYTNTTSDFMDLAILERFDYIINGKDIPIYKNHHPFNIIDLNTKIDSVLNNVSKHIKHENKTYNNMLSNIPLLYNGTAREFLLIKNIMPNKQSLWAIVLSRIDFITLLMDLSSDKTLRANKDTINDLLILFKKIDRENNLDVLDNYPYLKVQYELSYDIIKEQIGER